MSVPSRVVADSLRNYAGRLDEALALTDASDLRRLLEHLRANLLNSANLIEVTARRGGTWEEE